MEQYKDFIGLTLDDRYTLKRLVGMGGMAMVFEATDNLRKTACAVKLLKDEFARDEVSVQRFINESKAVLMLSHTNIVKIFDISVKGRYKYIVMEYIDGITLKTYMERKGALSVKETISYTVQILRALEHAHLGGIIHRDIKPQNIMLLKNGQIKVTDFGIAKLPDAKTLTATDKAIGTVYYISPEQAAGEKGIDRRTDLYSVGVLMYEMLTGKLPFDGENPVSIALKQINEEPRPPREIVPTIPRGLEQVILFAMEKDKDKRFQTATQMIDLLQKIKENPGVVFRQKNQQQSRNMKKKNKATMMPIIMGVVTAFLVVFMVSGFVIIKDIFFSEEMNTDRPITVKDYVGKVYDEELSEEISNTYIVKVKYEYNSEVPKGTVISQDPAGGSTRTGSNLVLYVSQGTEEMILDSYAYSDRRQAEIELKKMGLKIEIQSEFSDTVPDGCVISTVPEAGEIVNAGGTVILIVSQGEQVDMAVVPTFVGANTVDAYSMLVNNNLRFGSVTYVYSDTVAKGVIIDQFPSGGSNVPSGVTKVSFVISKGPEPIVTASVPNIEGLNYMEAVKRISASGFVAREQGEAYSDNYAKGQAFSQYPAPGTILEKGSIITYFVSMGSPYANAEETTNSDFEDWLSGRFN